MSGGRKEKANAVEGSSLYFRQARLKQGLKLSEVAQGICSVSYLSKLERGHLLPSPAIREKLSARLGLPSVMDTAFLSAMKQALQDYLEALFYHMDRQIPLQKLCTAEPQILNSPLQFAYRALLALEREQRDPLLEVHMRSLDARSRGLCQLARLASGGYQDPEAARDVDHAFHNSFSGNVLLQTFLRRSLYEEIKSHGEGVIRLALEEGNLYQLIQSHILLGVAYASESHLDQAMIYFKRAGHLINGSFWQKEKLEIYYNIGATLLEQGQLEEAAAYLEKIPRSYGFMLFHKLACLALARGDLESAQRTLQDMRVSAGKMPLRQALCAFVEMQLKPDYLDLPESLNTIRQLIRCIRSEAHLGYLRFHRALILDILRAHRLYKEALEVDDMLLQPAVFAENNQRAASRGNTFSSFSMAARIT